jgi:hypothetical protein
MIACQLFCRRITTICGLTPGFCNIADVTELLKPYNGTMRRYPVSSRVNAVANDDAACAERVALKQAAQGGLF